MGSVLGRPGGGVIQDTHNRAALVHARCVTRQKVERISTHPIAAGAAAAPVHRASLGERIIRSERGWFTDFAWADGRVVVRKTGATTRLDAEVLGHVLNWLRYFLVVRAMGLAKHLAARLTRRHAPAIWFSPEVPRPWYMIRSVACWAGLRVVRNPADADVAFHFDDSTWSPPGAPFAGPKLNYACRDIGKSRVAAVFAATFGYPLALDPRVWTGPAVEKSEANGLHDGRVVLCPAEPRAGRCYQRLVETGPDGRVQDLRTTCVDGVPVVTWVKTRTRDDRFASGANTAVATADPAALFSGEELTRIAAFNAVIGLDWGTLDILRDVGDGRIYIVDVNKTDVGPVLQLPMREKIASTRAIARALTTLIAACTPG